MSGGEGQITLHVDGNKAIKEDGKEGIKEDGKEGIKEDGKEGIKEDGKEGAKKQDDIKKKEDAKKTLKDRQIEYAKCTHRSSRSKIKKQRSILMKYITSVDIKRNVTVVANQRTLYSYYRTVLGYMALAMFSLKKFEFEPLGFMLLAAFLFLAATLFVHGRYASAYYHGLSQTGIIGEHNISIKPMMTDPDPKEDPSDDPNKVEVLSKHELAVIRTALANTRTFLAYQRTSMPAYGLWLAQMKKGNVGSSFVCGLLVFFFVSRGCWYWVKQQKIIEAKPPSLVLSTIRTVQANYRTILAFTRTVFGFVVVGESAFYVLEVADPVNDVVGAVFIVFAVSMFLYSVYSWLHAKDKIDRRQDLHQLALIRTVLANIRTYLANIRTFHPLAAFSFSMIKRFDGGGEGLMYACFAGVVALSIWCYGGFSWYMTRTYIQTDPSTHHLAIRRTELSNTRTFLAHSRVGLAIAALAVAKPDSVQDAAEYAYISTFVICGFLFCVIGVFHWNYKHQHIIMSWYRAGVE